MNEVGILERLDAAAAAILKRGTARPVVGLVLGSGLGAFAAELTNRVVVPYGQIPSFPVGSGVIGHAGELVLGTVGSTPVAVLSGRIH